MRKIKGHLGKNIGKGTAKVAGLALASAITTGSVLGALSLSFGQSFVMAQGIEGDNISSLESVNVINEGKVKALVVRLGFKDYPLDETNQFYRDDAYFYDIFNSEPGSDIRAGEPYDNAENFILRSSFGKQSLSLEKVVDIQMEHEQSYYYPEGKLNDYDFDHSEIYDIIESEEFLKKLSDAVDLSEYDSNNDGYADALYVFDMSPDNGAKNDYLGFYQGKEDKHPKPSLLYIYIPGEAWNYRDSENNIKRTLIHETGHMLWGLADLYGCSGFMEGVNANTIGNLMGRSNNGAGDVDGYSKYLTGWIGEENVTKLTKAEIMEKSREIHLQPSDGDAVQGKMLAVIDCGDLYKIAVEYVSGSNNNRSPLLDENPYGFRFYSLRDNEIVELYDNGEKSVFSEGDELSLFGKNIIISDIKTGEDPSLLISYDMDSVSKGLIKRTAYEYTFEREENCIYSNLFAYDDKRAAFIRVDENEKGILYLYENGSVTKLRDIDLAGTGGKNNNAFIHARKTNNGNVLLYGNTFIVKMDKDGNLLSPIINPPNGINSEKTILVGDRLICTYQHPLFLDNVYFDINLEDMSIQENNSNYHVICEIGQDKYLAANSDNEVVLDGKGNLIAVLKDINQFKCRVTETEDGYLSVEQKDNNGIYIYEVTRYDKSGNIVSSDYLREASMDGSRGGNKLFTDNTFSLGEGEIINTETGFLVTFSGGVIIVDGDTLEAEYIGKNAKKYEEYNGDFEPLYLNNGTIIAAAMDEVKSGIIVELDLPSNNESSKEEEEKENPNKDFVKNTADNPAEESDGTTEKVDEEVKKEDNDKDGTTTVEEKNSDNDDSEAKSAVQGAERKNTAVGTTATPVKAGTPVSVYSAPVRNAGGAMPVKSAVSSTTAAQTGDKTNVPFWIAASAGSVAAALGAFVIRRKKNSEE